MQITGPDIIRLGELCMASAAIRFEENVFSPNDIHIEMKETYLASYSGQVKSERFLTTVHHEVNRHHGRI